MSAKSSQMERIEVVLPGHLACARRERDRAFLYGPAIAIMDNVELALNPCGMVVEVEVAQPKLDVPLQPTYVPTWVDDERLPSCTSHRAPRTKCRNELPARIRYEGNGQELLIDERLLDGSYWLSGAAQDDSIKLVETQLVAADASDCRESLAVA